MAMALARVVNGLGLFVSRLWGLLQEQQFLATFEAVTSAVMCMTMSLTLCFLAIHRHARVEAGKSSILHVALFSLDNCLVISD
ncbi:hypothetical protein POTOM_024338 [Populus tomentosa]|uniref:Uncharacterized protein n=1 Tax=Populus tomentosa TaxID=118781 RepID=A0A8X8D1S6_POPTO|nr:hypothetical protein POTOM_024338 [Populus tomentosa]